MNHSILITPFPQRLKWQNQNRKRGPLPPNPVGDSVSLDDISFLPSVPIVGMVHTLEDFILACDFTPGPVGGLPRVGEELL